MSPQFNNNGAYIQPKYDNVIASFTAGTTYDAVKVTTTTGIDRKGYESAKYCAMFTAALASGKKLQGSLEISSCDTVGGSYDSAVPLFTTSTMSTGGSGGTTNVEAYGFDIDLAPYKRFIKFGFTPNLDATGTDTAVISTMAILGGADILPAV
jgi:hypothetical protein